jgi:DNA ligase-1
VSKCVIKKREITMSHAPFALRVTYWGLLLGGVLLPATMPAVAAVTATAEATALASPALMLAKNWQTGLDARTYLVSEKLDGVRAFWDGKVLRFKSGNPIAAPAWFVAALPPTALDGELWMGPRSFDRLSGIVRRNVPVDAEWREVRYMIFDLPGATGTFAERSTRLVALLESSAVDWLRTVAQFRVADSAALQAQLKSTVASGGEGLMLHRAQAHWQPGRSADLRKLKLVPDEDAKVVGHIDGKGKHAGRMGALLLESPEGKRFALGTGFTDAQREAPPAVGAFVTYRYRDRTPAGLPRFASFLRVREAE